MTVRVCPDEKEQRICECSDTEMELYCLPALIDEMLEMIGQPKIPGDEAIDGFCSFLINDRLRDCWKTWPTWEAFETEWNRE